MKKLKKPKLIFHYSFFIFLALSIALGRGVLFLMYVLCLLAHEIVHAIVAKRRGYEMGRIKLMATGAVIEAESDEFTFSDEIVIAISAPIFNLCVALLLIAFWWIAPESYNYTLDICVINLAIFAFNILPIFPLDGGRVLLAFLSKRMDRKAAVRISRAITISFSILLFGLFIISVFIEPNFSVGLMAVTLFLSGVSEDKMAVYKRAVFIQRKKARAKKRGLETRFVIADENASLGKMFSMLSSRFYTIFLLVDDNLKITGRLSEVELLEKIKKPVQD